MDSILHSPPLHSFSLHSSPPFPFSFPIRNQRFTPNSPKPPQNLISLASITPPITFPSKPTPTLPEPPKQQQQQQQQQNDDVLGSPVKCLLKQALFCFAVGVSALGAFRVPPATAIAAAASNAVVSTKKRANKEKAKSHEYADCTEKLLETVSGLLRSVEKVRSGNGDMNDVEAALKAVKTKKEEMRREINGRLYPQLRVLWRDRGVLVKRAGEIMDEILGAKGEYDKLTRKKKELDEKEKARVERIEERVGELEDEYNGIWEKVGEIEDAISRKETVALSYGVREINFTERECEQMVDRFKREMGRKDIKRSHTCIDILNALLDYVMCSIVLGVNLCSSFVGVMA